MAESEEELKSLLMKVKEESENAGSKLNVQKKEDHIIQSHHFMQIDGEAMETVTDFMFWGSIITADCDCIYAIIKYLLFGRKAMANLNSILKSRDITLSTKFHMST